MVGLLIVLFRWFLNRELLEEANGLLAPKEHELGTFVRRLYFRPRSIICHEG